MSSQLPRLGMMGITGIGQMTPAAQSVLQRAGRGGTVNGGGKRRRKAKKASSGGTRRKKKRAAAGGKGKLKKGSAAAKAWMAKIRKKRK